MTQVFIKHFFSQMGPSDLQKFPFVPIEIDGSVYKIHPVVSQLINSLTEQVKELVEINFPDFDESQKN